MSTLTEMDASARHNDLPPRRDLAGSDLASLPQGPSTEPAGRVLRVRLSTACIAWLVVALLPVLLLPVRIPLGGFYWDVDLFLNAAHRFSLGQLPHIDYFSQVGSLSLALFAGGAALFPRAQPLLLAQWSLLVISLPIFLPLLRETERRSRLLCIALGLPFVIFSVLPYNVNEYFVSQAPDGFGIYNRQAGLLIYVLVAVIFWSENRVLQTIACTVILCALTFIKITAFVPGFVLIGYGVIAGRLKPMTFIAALGSLILLCLALDAWRGLMSAYLSDITVLAGLNNASILARAMAQVARQFDMLAFFGVILATCLYREFYQHRSEYAGPGAVRKVLASDSAWIVVAVVTSVLYESQNTGSNEFVYLWPVWVRVLINATRHGPRMAYWLGVLVAVANLPSVTAVVQRAVRATIQSVILVPLPAPQVGGLAQVMVRPDNLERARFLLGHYPLHLSTYADLAVHGEMQSVDLFAKSDFQALYLLSLEEAVTATRAYEKLHGIRFTSAFTLDFVDPMPRLLDVAPPRLVSLANDPRRTSPLMDAALIKEVDGIEAIFSPQCPPLPDRDAIKIIFRPVLAHRRPVEISPCWTLWLRDEAGQAAAAKP